MIRKPTRPPSTTSGPDEPIRLSGYDPSWPARFEEEKAALEDAIGDRVVGGTDPRAAAEYTELKRGLARRFRYDREAYTEAKSEFIRRILDRRT